MSSLNALLKIASGSIDNPASSGVLDAAGKMPCISEEACKDFLRLYSEKNGFYAFESSLWVYSLNIKNKYSLQSINQLPELEVYSDTKKDGIFFAADALGDQFMVNDQGYWGFDLEVSDAAFIAKDLDGWAQAVLDDYEHLLWYPFARDWQAIHGALPLGKRLTGKIPLSLGGEYAVENLGSVDIRELIDVRAYLYKETKDLPEGSKIKIEIVP